MAIMGQINLVHVDYAPNYPNNWFALFLFIAVCIILARTVRLAWRLWSLRRRHEFSDYTSHNPEAIAQAALKGLFRRDDSITPERVSDMALIDARFMFLWETYHAMVQSTRRLAGLTVLLSFSVAALGCINICAGFMTEETAGIAAGAGGGIEVFEVLARGLFVAAFFYALVLLFEGTLARRKRDWKYLRTKLNEEFHATHPTRKLSDN
jgi:hypothetical protein